ncbi:response regulator [Consotaella aegiceratis]|uniref:response regulator n=1 Tax=Consotaella aegiceratis TaxID=3097961 RepID=UPI002F3E219B
MQPHHILVVEDDPVAREMLTAYFSTEGYRVSGLDNGQEMRAVMAREAVDLILLDIRLPGDDGLHLLREIRSQSEVGVIMVTSKTDVIDRIVALEMGADDYVVKPFNARELLARSRNLLRRTMAAQTGAADVEKHFDGWVLDVSRRLLFAPDGVEVKLTRGEFELLSAFLNRPGQVMNRDCLLDSVSQRDWASSDRTIDVLVGRLRRKIEDDPKNPHHIVTMHGVGYVFATPLRQKEAGGFRPAAMRRSAPASASLGKSRPPARKLFQ